MPNSEDDLNALRAYLADRFAAEKLDEYSRVQRRMSEPPRGAEMHSTNTPLGDTIVQMTGQTGVGPVVSNYDRSMQRAVSGLKDATGNVFQATGIPMMVEGAQDVGEGIAEGDSSKAAWGAVQAAAPIAAPAVLSTAGRLATAAPRVTAGGIGGTVLFDSAEAGEKDYGTKVLELSKKEDMARRRVTSLEDELRGLIADRDEEAKSGKGPNYRRKRDAVVEWKKTNDDILKEAKSSLTALQGRLKALEAEESPAAIRKRNAETPIADLYPTETALGQAAMAAAGIIGSAALRGRHVSQFNKLMKDLNTIAADSSKAAKKAISKGDTYRGSALLDEAKIAKEQAAALAKKGPEGWKSEMLTAVAGMETAALGPTVVDYGRSAGNPESPLYKKAIESVTAGEFFPGSDMAARVGLSGLAGMGLSKLGSGVVGATMGVKSPGAHGPVIDALTRQASGETAKQARGIAASLKSGRSSDVMAASGGATKTGPRQLGSRQAKQVTSQQSGQKLLPASANQSGVSARQQAPQSKMSGSSSPQQSTSIATGQNTTRPTRPGNNPSVSSSAPRSLPLGVKDKIKNLAFKEAEKKGSFSGISAENLGYKSKAKGVTPEKINGYLAELKQMATNTGHAGVKEQISALKKFRNVAKFGVPATGAAVAATTLSDQSQAAVPDDFDEKFFAELIDQPEATEDNVRALAAKVLGKLPVSVTDDEMADAMDAFMIWHKFK